MNSPRILLYDVETSPMTVWAWSRWQEGCIDVLQESHLLCATWKWLGEKKVQYIGINEFPALFKKDPRNDIKVTQKLHELFEEADITVAHNGDKFDRRKCNTAFAMHKLAPPAPYRTVDTLKVARYNFAFSSNKLDDLGHLLGLGRKVKHPGFEMWKGCMDGDATSWKMMKNYAIGDIVLLEKVYLELLPWMDRHPNLTIYSGKAACPKCGASKDQLHRRGNRQLVTGTYARYQCQACKGWCRKRLQEKAGRIIPEQVN